MGAEEFQSKMIKWHHSRYFVLSTVISSAMPISMIVMGALYKDDCPVEDMIAIYLIVMGSVTLSRTAFSMWVRSRDMERDNNTPRVNPIMGILDTFLFAWFIAGCVYIYRTKDKFQSDDSKGDDFCDYAFYWYSFWITTSSFILLGVIIAILCCVFYGIIC